MKATRETRQAAGAAHSKLVADIRLDLGLVPDLVLWQNVQAAGDVWVPETGATRHIRAGLAKGCSDLIGCLDGRFLALEAKTGTGRLTSDQEQFGAVVRAKGGFACVVRSVDEARAAIARARAGANQ